MSMQDPIADMFTRIRNGQMAEKVSVEVPSSKIKIEMEYSIEFSAINYSSGFCDYRLIFFGCGKTDISIFSHH